MIKVKDVLNKVFEELDLNSDILIDFSALGISKVPIEDGGRSYHYAKLIIKMISNHITELVYLENPHWNGTKQKIILRLESKRLNAINDSVINVLLYNSSENQFVFLMS